MTRGGWTVIQRRSSIDVDFQRNYQDYTNGFGNVSGNHWLGLEHIHLLTAIPGTTSSLRVDFELYNGTRGYQTYHNASVGNSASGYVLHVTGTPQDVSTLQISGAPTSSYSYGLYYNNGRKFSTTDMDRRGCTSPTSSSGGGGGRWWFGACSYVNVNGRYGVQSDGGITMSGGVKDQYHTNPMLSVRRN
jgi:ficolin